MYVFILARFLDAARFGDFLENFSSFLQPIGQLISRPRFKANGAEAATDVRPELIANLPPETRLAEVVNRPPPPMYVFSPG